jgi:hypothetical protein
MIYTQYNTQKEKNFYYYQQNVHLEQTAIAAPIDKLISSNIVPTLKQIILIAASKRLSKTFLEFYKFYVCRGDLEPAGQTTLI